MILCGDVVPTCDLGPRSLSAGVPQRSGDHYELLGVSAAATLEELRAAWRTLVRANHPDRVPAGEDRVTAADRTARINEAYRVLADPARRAAYDRSCLSPVTLYTPPPYVGSVHLGLAGMGRLAVGVGAALALILVGAVVGVSLLVGVGALMLPACGVWFLVDELDRTADA
jgi:hypothetical protein